jgi:bifunctional DNase/RNase
MEGPRFGGGLFFDFYYLTLVSRMMYFIKMLVPVEISSLAVDTAKGTPLVILKDSVGRVIAIPLDHSDANAIAMHTLQVRPDKPLAVDLVRLVVEQLGASVYRAVISDVGVDGGFSASIIIRADRGASIKVIDCRPCDAVVLAARSGAPIFVRERVFSKQQDGSGMTEEEKLKSYVRSIDTLEFGTYVLE